MHKKVWVTGSRGFIGSNLVRHLNQNSISDGSALKVFEFAGNILDPKLVAQSIEQANPDVVIHLAAISHTHLCEKDRTHAHNVNVVGTQNVFKAVSKTSAQKRVHFVFPSTAQVYKTKNSGSIDENSEVEPVNFYAETKLAAERFLHEESSRSNCQVTVARLFNHVHHSQPPITFLASVYQQLLKAKPGETPNIRVGNLELIRDIGSVFDLMNAFEKMTAFQITAPGFSTFNIGSGIGRRLGEVARTLAHAMKIEANFVSVPEFMRPTDPAQMVANINRFRNTFSWSPSAITNKDLIRDFLKEI